MRKNAKKCTQVCTVHGLYLSNSLFSKDSIEQMSLNVKNIKFGDSKPSKQPYIYCALDLECSSKCK